MEFDAVTLQLRTPREKSPLLDKEDIVPLKEAYKWLVQSTISTELGGVFVVTKVIKVYN